MSAVQPPIIVVEGGDIDAFPTLADALGSVEAMDVRDGLFSVFDSTGRRLILNAVTDQDPVELVRVEADPASETELRTRLVEFLAQFDDRGPGINGDRSSEVSTLDLTLRVLNLSAQDGRPTGILDAILRRFRRSK